MRGARREVEIAAAAFRVKAQRHCDRFEQRRFSRAVLADEECHRLLEGKFIEAADCGNGERKTGGRWDLLAQKMQADQKIARLTRRCHLRLSSACQFLPEQLVDQRGV